MLFPFFFLPGSLKPPIKDMELRGQRDQSCHPLLCSFIYQLGMDLRLAVLMCVNSCAVNAVLVLFFLKNMVEMLIFLSENEKCGK